MVSVWWPPALKNRKFENNHEINHNQDAFIKLYKAERLFYNQTIENIHLIVHATTIFNLLKEWIKRSVNIFHLRLCRLLEGPKRPIRTLGIEPEIQSKTPTVARQITWNITAHPGSHQRRIMV